MDASGNPLRLTLPAGAAVGSHRIDYSATVTATSGVVRNQVVGGSNCTTAQPCATQHDVGSVTVGKTLQAESGSRPGIAEPGETLTYAVTVTNPGALPVTGYAVTDTLGAGLQFVSASHGGVNGGATTNWTGLTIPAGGSLVLTERALVASPVTAASVRNLAKPAGSPDPACPGPACVVTPTAGAVTLAKALIAETGSQPGVAEPGETLTWRVTLANAGGSAASFDLTDTLSAGLAFVSASDGGTNAGATTTWTALAVPAGGSRSVTISATVLAPITTQTVSNLAKPTGAADPACPGAACLVTPTAAVVTLVKTLVGESGSQPGIAEPGEQLSYALTLTNTGGSPASYDLVDRLGAGLAFVSATNGGVAGGGTVNWTGLPVPAGGTLVVGVVAQVESPIARESVANLARPLGGPPDPSCPSVWCVVTPTASAVAVAKSALPAAGSGVATGQTITYTLTATVSGRPTPTATVLTDTLGAGLRFGIVTSPGPFTVDGGGAVHRFTLPAGTPAGSYSVSYTAVVTATGGSVGNSVVGGGNCSVGSPCTTSHPLGSIVLTKTLSAESGSVAGIAEPGETLTWTLAVRNTGAAAVVGYALTDVLGPGLSYAASSPAGAHNAGTTTWSGLTIPAGAALQFTESAVVDAVLAQPTVRNLVRPAGGSDPACPGSACTVTPTPATVALTKALASESGRRPGVAEPGETLGWQITLTNSGGADARFDLSDTLSAGLQFAGASHGGVASGQTITWTGLVVPANGRLVVDVTATVVSPVQVARVSNLAKPTGAPDPACPGPACVVTPTAAQVVVSKQLSGESGRITGQAEAGEQLTYTLTLDNGGGEDATGVRLVDVLGPGLAYVSSTPAGTNSGAQTVWSGLAVPAGGRLALTLVARVVAPVTTASVRNLARLDGEADPPCPGSACVDTPTAAYVAPVKRLASEDGARAGRAEYGETLGYTITLGNAGGTAFTNFRFVEHVPLGATLVGVSGASGFAGPVDGPADVALQVAEVPARGSAVVGVRFRVADPVPASVTDIVNRIDGGDIDAAACGADCVVSTPVEVPAQITVVKSAAVREARVGDLVRYTLRIRNVGRTDLVAGSLVDTPPAGFSLVAGSVQLRDDDGAFSVGPGQRPLQVRGLDLAAGHEATMSYLLRVGAAVPKGTHANRALVQDARERTVSNIASAAVAIVGDPMLDETLVLGTVFDDRDGDGWQDPAVLTGVAVRGGLAPDAATGAPRIERADGTPAPVPAGDTLAGGLRIGRIDGRQSEADRAESHQIVVRQPVAAPRFEGDFVLTSDQGFTLRVDARGRNELTLAGDAARGLTAAQPVVERRVAQDGGGAVVDWVIRNDGIEERGIPGVRIATPEGLLMETDPFGRFHLVGLAGGPAERGRNVVLKVDPATLPPGSRFTTPNPLVRRVTPGLPVRYDFGVGLPVQAIGGGRELVEIALGELLFEPGSALLRDAYLPVLRRIAAQAEAHGGGELVIAADGERPALALARAEAVQRALLPLLSPEVAKALNVVVRGEPKAPASLLAGVGAGRTLVGTVLFDTDSAVVRPAHAALLDQLAHTLNEQRHGALVTIVGHADLRAGDAYNLALGLRRAKAVYEALAQRLDPALRERLRVEVAAPPGSPPPSPAQPALPAAVSR